MINSNVHVVPILHRLATMARLVAWWLSS